MASERLQVDEQLDSKIDSNLILGNASFPCQNALKIAPQKLNFLMAKDISKRYTLDSSCTLMPLRVPV